MKQLWILSWPWSSPAHPSPARPGFSVGRIAVSLVRQPGALGRWQGVRASGRGPLKSHLRGATPTRPLRWRLFWASPEAARLPFLEQQQSRPHAVASGKWGEGRFLLYFQSKCHWALGEFLHLHSGWLSQWREIVYLLDETENKNAMLPPDLSLWSNFCPAIGNHSLKTNEIPHPGTFNAPVLLVWFWHFSQS